MFNFYVPGFMYRQLPWLYIGAGVVTVIRLPGILGTVSGLLLVGAGVLVLRWRTPKTTGHRARATTRSQKLHASHRASSGDPVSRAHRARPSLQSRDDAVPASPLQTGRTGELSKPPTPGGNGPSERRRNSDDRRSWRPMPRTPFFDSQDVMVTKDRRKIPDRRRGNIVVEEL